MTTPANTGETGQAPAARAGDPRLPMILLGCGAFLAVLGLLVRLHVYPSGLGHPVDPDEVVRLRATGASYFDLAGLRQVRGADIEVVTALRGNPGPAPDRAVWTEITSTLAGDRSRIGYRERRVAVDRFTGMAVNCCGEYVDNDRNARQAGLSFRWPFGAARRDYPFYDPELRQAAPMRFDGVETVRGVRVHRYTQRIEPTLVEELRDPLPGAAVGMPGRARVALQRWYSVDRTYWVEPSGGLPVAVREAQRQTLRTADGTERAVLFQADLRTDENDVEALTARAARFVTWSRWMSVIIPAGLGGAGMVTALAGLYLLRRTRSRFQVSSSRSPGTDTTEAAQRGW
ncbi:DUF3068 domain-containing protein [Bailinhaonella thermotolerans]|nr:DUF3068 domain-containing protein [Bailinhaonella thermotolerans]